MPLIDWLHLQLPQLLHLLLPLLLLLRLHQLLHLLLQLHQLLHLQLHRLLPCLLLHLQLLSPPLPSLLVTSWQPGRGGMLFMLQLPRQVPPPQGGLHCLLLPAGRPLPHQTGPPLPCPAGLPLLLSGGCPFLLFLLLLLRLVHPLLVFLAQLLSESPPDAPRAWGPPPSLQGVASWCPCLPSPSLTAALVLRGVGHLLR